MDRKAKLYLVHNYNAVIHIKKKKRDKSKAKQQNKYMILIVCRGSAPLHTRL